MVDVVFFVDLKLSSDWQYLLEMMTNIDVFDIVKGSIDISHALLYEWASISR